MEGFCRRNHRNNLRISIAFSEGIYEYIMSSSMSNLSISAGEGDKEDEEIEELSHASAKAVNGFSLTLLPFLLLGKQRSRG